MDHLLHGHGDRGFVAQNGHAQGISDQDDVHAGFVQDTGGGKIIGRQDDDPFAGFLHRPKGRRRDFFGFVFKHVDSFLPIRPRPD